MSSGLMTPNLALRVQLTLRRNIKSMRKRRAPVLPVVTDVSVLGHWRLRLTFSDGRSGTADLSDLAAEDLPLLIPLRDPEYFAQVRVSIETGTLEWPNGADLSREYLLEHLQPDPVGRWRRSRRPPNRRMWHPELVDEENWTVVFSDIVGFEAITRTDEDRRIIREAVLSMTQAVMQGMSDMWAWDNRGDGVLTVVPPSVPAVEVIEHLQRDLPAALEKHNRAYHDSARIRLRIAVNVGPVTSDAAGVSDEAITVTAHLVRAPIFERAMDTSGASLGVIASRSIYEAVIKNAQGLAGYSRVQADIKDSSTSAWMKLIKSSNA
jgi:class 3 adenylate cyclase